MPPLFWSGKLTLPMRLLIDASNLLSLMVATGNSPSEMKERVRGGYEGEFSDHVRRYDESGYQLQDRSARIQLEDLSFNAGSVLDVGCGTGALAQVAFEYGAQKVTCADISSLMLKEARAKEISVNADYSFCQLDAEGLPYADGAFDAAISGMTFGTLPNQELATEEMVRVTRPGAWCA